MTDQVKTPTWVYIAVGCGGAILLALVALGVVGYLGYRWVEDVKETHEDPASREAKVLEILGADSIPEGYYGAAGVSIPFVMQLAVLSDREPRENGRTGGFDERGFIYIEMIRLGGQQDELEAFFRGEVDDPEILRENNIRIDVEEIVGRGSIEGETFDLDYFAHRGGLEAAGGHGRGLSPDQPRGRAHGQRLRTENRVGGLDARAVRGPARHGHKSRWPQGHQGARDPPRNPPGDR